MKCIIVDDEPLAREGMIDLVKTRTDLNLVESFKNATNAEEFLKVNDIDLIFLDIEMPGIDGLEFAEGIPKKTLVIFTTAYKEYAFESYKVDAVDYLLKPISEQHFNKVIDKAFRVYKLLQKEETRIEEIADDFIFIKSERRYYKILFDKILFIEGLKDYVIIYTENDKVIPAMNLKTIHRQLPKSMFIRVSKSYIVNETAIDSFDSNTIYINKHEIPIGKVFQEGFQKTYLGKNL